MEAVARLLPQVLAVRIQLAVLCAEVVVDRCALEDTLLHTSPLTNLVIVNLHHHAEAFNEEDTAEDRQHQLLVDDDGTYRDDTADGQRTRIAHEKGSKYALQAGDTLDAIRMYQNRMGAFAILGKIDSAIMINLNAAKMFKHIGKNYEASLAYGCNYDLYLQQSDAQKAQEAFNAYISTNFEGSMEFDDSKAYVLYERGYYYLYMGQLDSTYYYLKKSLNLCKSDGNKAATTKALAQYYSKVNQPNLAIQFALKSLAYQDSDFIKTRNTQLQQMQAMYDYGRNREIARIAEQKAKRSMQINYIIVLSCIILFLLLSYIYRKQLAFKKKKIAVSKLMYEDSLLKLKRLQDEKNKLVAENDKQLAQVITEKENTINKLKSEISDIQEKYSLSSMSDAELTLMDSSIYKKIKFIEVHPKKDMSEEDWKDLADTIESAIPNFIPRLKNKLRNKDYQICLLIRLGFSTSLIARLLEVSDAAISKSRKTMLKKLCGKDGKPKEFDEYVLQIQ